MESRAFEELVVRYQGVVCGVAYAILRDRARSEEVAQEAFLLAWHRLAEGPIGAGWICATARNLAWNAARRRTEVPMLDDEEPFAPTRDARDELIAREDAAQTNAALAALPEKYRDAITIYYYGDESMTAVAEALGISHANARQRVHRGRELLREALGSVESTLRAARPAAAFTAACVALWVARGNAHAAAAASTASVATSGGITTALGWIFGLSVAGAFSLIVIDEIAADASTASTASTPQANAPKLSAPTVQRVAGPAGPPPPPPSMSTATASWDATSPPRPNEPISIHFPNAPIRPIVSLIANEMNIPIRVEDGFEATVDCDATDTPALELLDQLLDQANAKRIEMTALRIVQSGGSTDASALGGDLISLQLHDVPIRDALREIEAKLHVTIERDVKPGQLPGPSNVDGDLYILTPGDDSKRELFPHVTINVANVTAGEALEQVLEQTGLGFEQSTGFLIVPR